MYARKLFAGLATSAVAVSALAALSSPAHAVTTTADPDDSAGTPVAADLIGVGSDTSQHALKLLADGYNATSPAPAAPMFTYSATGGGNVTLPSGDIPRPNGSSAGKALLYGSSNNTDVDFARSSSAESTGEQQAGLQSFPFALDTLVTAVSKDVASHAPTSITAAQLVQIYEGNTTDWSQIGGSAGTIVPLIPQSGSGTAKFFVAQLTAANNGVAITLGKDVQTVQEHDPTPIENDPNAIAPFSKGRAGLPENVTHVSVEGGFSADRALYNVVRGTDVGSAAVAAAFGSSGYICSTAARDEISAAGFKQLATPAQGGVCGAPTSDTTSNFVLSGTPVTTKTVLTVTSPKVKSATLTAKVTGSSAPSGTVTFSSGSTVLKSGVPLTSGQATYTLPATVGTHTYHADFVPDTGSQYVASSDDGTGVVRTSSTITESFPATVKQGSKAKGVVKVVLAGVTSKATGAVKIYKGSKLLKSATLAGGKVTVKLPALVNGKNTLKVVWAGNTAALGSTKTFTIKQIKKKK